MDPQLPFSIDLEPDSSAILSATWDEGATSTAVELLNSYIPVFLIAYFVALIATPIARQIALKNNIIDRPDSDRKIHREAVAYLGGGAVVFAVLVGIGLSYTMFDAMVVDYRPVPIAIVIGIIAIAFTGLADDIWGWDPRLKVAGQLVAAAALAIEAVGTDVARGLLVAIFGSSGLMIEMPITGMSIDVSYWIGTALIAIFVLGGCNASNLVDGLDGLLSGLTGIVMLGLLVISVLMAVSHEIASGGDILAQEDSLAGARVVLCLATLGAVLGFLPFNFHPAVIFLGDAGSLLLGYLSVVIILMFGEYGETHLVVAGLIVFAVPIIDTALAIIRRKMAGRPMSSADNQHIHHQLNRGLGGTRRAVFALYGIGITFACLGILVAWMVLFTEIRLLVVYAIVFVLFSFIGAVAVKIARRQPAEIQVDEVSLGSTSSSSAK
ncbi:MAG: MraY family glycosyltransferase [Phycisphaerales bacterium]|nr:MraY family glycosyltransferase [Phycisphaerales bacterium]